MEVPYLTAQQKYEQFCKTHPQYKNLGRDKICSIMLKSKLLSSE